MADPRDGWSRGPGRHGRARVDDGQRSSLVRYQWYGALLAGVVAATGAIILMNSHDGRLASRGCGMVSCSAALPGSTSAAPQGSPRSKRTAPAHPRAAAAPVSSPSPSAKTLPATPSPSASPEPSTSHHGHAHGHAGGRHGHGHGGPALASGFQSTSPLATTASRR